MTWRDQLQPASFKGAAFFVDGHEAQLGRRVHVHEFPLRDQPYPEDLGRKARQLTVQAYVLGDSYMQARNRLMVAVEKAGPGQLVHPYLGELRCTVLDCKVTESTAEGGMARFTLQLVEAGDARFPTEATNTTAAVAAAADFAAEAVRANFARRHNCAGKPAFVADASRSILGGALDRITASVGLVRGAADAAAALQRDVGAARRDLTTLVYTPASAAQAVLANVKQLVRSVATAPRDALSLARTLYRYGDALPEVKANTTSRKAQAVNQAELVRLVRTAGLTEGARAVSGTTFDSYQDALVARNELVDGLDDVMLANDLVDEVYDALRALRAAVVRDVAARGANLTRLVRWAPAATLPVLVVAQQLYADASRADELLVRNSVRHPLFVAGAVPLEVLADA